MRSFAEEKRQNTIEVLLTLPFSETQIVAAKFLAVLTIVSFGLILTFGLPISLSLVAKVYYPEIVIGYLGEILFAAGLTAIAIFFSSLTKNQIVAFLVSILVSFLLLVLSTDFLATAIPKFIQDFLTNFTPLYHLENFVKGILDIRSLIYFLSLIAGFLFLTIVNLEKRN